MIELWLPALLAAISVACVAGPLGSFLIWRRMVFFADVFSHGCLLGLALGILWQLSETVSILLFGLLLAVSTALLQQQRIFSDDLSLGVLGPGTLSLGIVLLSLMGLGEDQIMNWLVGDILAIQYLDLIWIFICSVLVICMLFVLWRPLLLLAIDDELAQVEGWPVLWLRGLLIFLIALVIAVAMRLVGVLLIVALMIIPAASARLWARTPESMVVLSGFIGSVAAITGVCWSVLQDVPVGPAVAVNCFVIFIISLLLSSEKIKQQITFISHLFSKKDNS